MLLECLADVLELRERRGQMFLEFRNRLGRANAGHNVLALRIDQEFAVENLFARGRVARKGNAGTGLFPRVAIDHRLDVDGGSPFGRNVVLAAVHDRSIIHPRAEYGADGAPKLLPGILRELFSGSFLDQTFESLHQFFQIIDR